MILPLFESLFSERKATVEYRFWHRDGSLRWISATYVSQRDEAADCWRVNSCATDITERKATEARLAIREEQLRLALELTNAGFWDWNTTTNQGIWNPNHSRLLGLEPQEGPVSYETGRGCVHPEDLSRAEAAVLESLNTGEKFEADDHP